MYLKIFCLKFRALPAYLTFLKVFKLLNKMEFKQSVINILTACDCYISILEILIKNETFDRTAFKMPYPRIF